MRRMMTSLALFGAGLLLCAAAGAELVPAARYPWWPKAQATYARVPERVRAVPVTLRDFRGLPHDSEGMYWPQHRQYGPLIGLTGWDRRTLLHELGHHSHCYGLSGEEWGRWVALWREHRRRLPRVDHDYARTNAAEGYAVVFEQWVRGQRLHAPLREFFVETQLRPETAAVEAMADPAPQQVSFECRYRGGRY